MIEYLKKIGKNNPIEDIYVVGFTDIEDGIMEFYSDLERMYFEMSYKYFAFESVEQYSRIKMKITDEISYDYEIDEDMTRARSSVSEIILNDTMSEGNIMEQIIFYNLDEQQNKDELICDAIEITLVNGQTLFLDPSYYFGINIGGNRQKELWKLNYQGEQEDIRETLVRIDDV